MAVQRTSNFSAKKEAIYNLVCGMKDRCQDSKWEKGENGKKGNCIYATIPNSKHALCRMHLFRKFIDHPISEPACKAVSQPAIYCLLQPHQ